MKTTTITLTDDHIEMAYYLTGREKEFDASLTQCSKDSRAVGILGEMAAAEFLRGMYGVNRSVIPMGIVARSGGGLSAYGMGDIITVKNGPTSQKQKEVHTFEVKARTRGAGKGNLIRCDSAEAYVCHGIKRVIFVDVDIQPDRAVCEVVGYHQPVDILEWDVVTNGMGQECRIMPV
ncbi:MAG: hypothetical protein [Bacteriophage sp.]|nr:MAG: hypothetical protein [Bacteriophage sp.]